MHLSTYSLVQTIWSRVDEAQHFHYVQYLAENRVLPVMGQTFISSKVVDVSLAVDQWGWNPPRTVAPPDNLDSQTWTTIPRHLQGEEKFSWIAQNLWYFSYEAMQPPLFYALGAVVYAGLPDDSFLQIYALRLFSAFIASITVFLAYLTVREAMPGNPLLALAVPATIALMPGFVLNLSQVTNDSLITALASLCFLVLVRGIRRGFDTRRAVLVGFIIGLSLLTKLTAIYLIPVALMALALSRLSSPFRPVHQGRAYAFSHPSFPQKRESRLRAAKGAVDSHFRGNDVGQRRSAQLERIRPTLVGALRPGLMVVAVPALLVLPWFLRNWVTYGDPMGTRMAGQMLGAIFRPVLIASVDIMRQYLGGSLNHLGFTFWFGEPFPPWQNWDFAFTILTTVSVVAVFGLLFFFRRPKDEEGERDRLVVSLMVAAMGIHVVEILVGPLQGGLGTVGRYLYPSIVPAMTLLWLGVLSIVREEVQKYIVSLFLFSLLTLDLVNLIVYLQTSYAS